MDIKKYYPFIIPMISLLLVMLLAFRWYNLRTQRNLTDDMTQVEIENLTQDEIQLMQGNQDITVVDLEPEKEVATALGQVRYKIEEEKVLITVTATLTQESGSIYQVWFKASNKTLPQRVFVLEHSKAGYLGSASVNKDDLPLEVIISDQTGISGDEMGTPLLKGIVEVK